MWKVPLRKGTLGRGTFGKGWHIYLWKRVTFGKGYLWKRVAFGKGWTNALELYTFGKRVVQFVFRRLSNKGSPSTWIFQSLLAKKGHVKLSGFSVGFEVWGLRCVSVWWGFQLVSRRKNLLRLVLVWWVVCVLCSPFWSSNLQTFDSGFFRNSWHNTFEKGFKHNPWKRATPPLTKGTTTLEKGEPPF